MGHANLTNISTFFVDLVHARGTVTIREVVTELARAGEGVHASEGLLTDPYMLSYACEEVVHFLLERHGLTARTPQRKRTPVLEPVEPLTPRQEEILRAWLDGDVDRWDSGDDGDGGEYGELDAIPWRLAAEWAAVEKDRIPLLTNHTN